MVVQDASLWFIHEEQMHFNFSNKKESVLYKYKSTNDWRRANVLDQPARIYEKWNQYNISIVFVPKLVDMYIVFDEKLLVYLFCLQNKWKKYI